MIQNLDALQHSISSQTFTDESQCVSALLTHLPPSDISAAASETAKGYINTLRMGHHHAWLEDFLHTYGLNTHEGVALMCLSEALLRIPDSTTADQLIHSTFFDTNWKRYVGTSHSLFVNASSWGLLLTGKMIQLEPLAGNEPVTLVEKLMMRIGEPVLREAIKYAMRFIGSQFVLGETIEKALHNSAQLEKAGYCFSFDMLGEGARTQEQAESYTNAYLHAITTLAHHSQGHQTPSISVKLSALHPRYQLQQQERVLSELYPRLLKITHSAMQHTISLSIDAEESTRLDIEMLLFKKLCEEPALNGFEGIGFVLQAYQKRAFYVIDWLKELSKQTHRRIPVRLVKGAYWDSEIKAAQIAGLASYPVFTRKAYTDISYLACAQKLLQHCKSFYPQFATHNALTIASIVHMTKDIAPTEFEFQRLHGMGDALHRQLVKEYTCRIYAPVGHHKDLLAYLIRRLLENGANTSFVHLLSDEHTPLTELLQSPVELATLHQNSPHSNLPLPAKLYPDRANSAGIDFGNLASLTSLLDSLSQPIQEPSLVSDSMLESLEISIQQTQQAFTSWNNTPVRKRIECIKLFAELLAKHQHELVEILIEEAGKTIQDSLAEVREAIDFCNYYALQSTLLMNDTPLAGPTGEHNVLSLHGRGIFVCISPWNFPLAIFTGQVVAALLTGNSVIAKPAEQTPRIACVVTALLHQAGIPREVLHVTPGKGEIIGAALVSDHRISGIVFTGSLATAHIINRELAKRMGAIIPFIAETGGQNCMVVDSSALLEQATDDIIQSAFGSAGQRCSALRVVFVQDSIADALIHLLQGAMHELTVGNPNNFATDIGPIIDEEAAEHLWQHISLMTQKATLLAKTPYSSTNRRFVPPHLFEIQSLSELTHEVFGPILHLIRYRPDALPAVCKQINETGYGLTFGIQSRISETIHYLQNTINAGNIYVNRTMIGATVGVQPFGGNGLSGTGPKAGGPYYLLRFMNERTLTVNTSAIGGNIDLLTK